MPLAQGHTTSTWQSWALNLSLLSKLFLSFPPTVPQTTRWGRTAAENRDPQPSSGGSRSQGG